MPLQGRLTIQDPHNNQQWRKTFIRPRTILQSPHSPACTRHRQPLLSKKFLLWTPMIRYVYCDGFVDDLPSYTVLTPYCYMYFTPTAYEHAGTCCVACSCARSSCQQLTRHDHLYCRYSLSLRIYALVASKNDQAVPSSLYDLVQGR
jgi:hypothetical protein